MIHLREDQLVALARDDAGSFLDRAAAYLARELPHTLGALPREERVERVRRLWARARAAGIRAERDVVLFASMCARFGEGFEEQPWARAILDDPDVPSIGERLRRLDARGRARQEIEARNARLREELLGDRAG